MSFILNGSGPERTAHSHFLLVEDAYDYFIHFSIANGHLVRDSFNL